MHMLDMIRLPRRVPDYPVLYYHYNTISTLGHFISLSSVIMFVIILCTLKRNINNYSKEDKLYESYKFIRN